MFYLNLLCLSFVLFAQWCHCCEDHRITLKFDRQSFLLGRPDETRWNRSPCAALEAYPKIWFFHTCHLFIRDSLSKNFSSTTLHRWKSNKEPSIFMLMLPPYHSNQKSSLSFIAHVKTPWLRKYFTHYCKKLTLLIRDQIFKLVQFNFQVGFIYTRSCYFKCAGK